MSKPSRQVLVLANATRLLNDARILADHHSFATAFALAVLAMEEIGKALIDGWSAEARLPEARSRSLHIQKQLAVSSLKSQAKNRSIAPLQHLGSQASGQLARHLLRHPATRLQ